MLSLRQSPGGLEDGAPGYGETRIQGRGGEELPTALPMEGGVAVLVAHATLGV